MRRGIIVGYKHGSGQPEVICGPEVPMDQLRARMREAKQGAGKEGFETIELWTSDAGMVARKRHGLPVEEKKFEQTQASENETAADPAAAKDPEPSKDAEAEKTPVSKKQSKPRRE